MRIELGLKSNEELAETAGKAAGKTALALVSVTARYHSYQDTFQNVPTLFSCSSFICMKFLLVRDSLYGNPHNTVLEMFLNLLQFLIGRLDKKYFQLTLLSSTVLYCSALHCIVLYSAVLNCSIFSVGASYVVSTEARQTVEAIMSASKAVTDMGINIRDAFTAASVAWDSPTKSSNDGISRTLDGFLLVLRSSDVKTALAALKDNAQKSTDDAGRAADLTSRHVAKSLKNSRRWKNALADLGESVTLLLSIFALSGTRFIQEVQAETNRQLPEAK